MLEDRTPLLSVVITTHNRKNLVVRAIESAITQTYKNIEIVIVSDGSTDGTSEIICSQYSNIKKIKFYEYHPAQGANYARNYGASKAEGEYIAFLDDDDVWHADKAEKQLEKFMEDSEVGLVTAGMHFIYVNNKSESNYIPIVNRDSSKDILIKNVIGGTPAVMMKRSMFEDVGGFDISLGALQDYDLWVRLCQNTKVGVVSETCVDAYDYFDPEKISNNCDRYIEAYKNIEVKYQELYRAILNEKEEKMRKYTFNMLIAKKGLRNSNKQVAVRYALSALKNKLSLQPILVICLSLFPYSVVLKIKNVVKG